MAWIKGSRCGIDNCASRFYQVLSGQRVCQNGHVQVGLETTGDDDDFVAVGQRLARPRSTKSSQLAKGEKESNIVRGRAAKLKTVELLQVVFRQQVRVVSAKKHMPAMFETVARDLWRMFLNYKGLENIMLLELVALVYLATRAIDFPILLSDFNLWIRSSNFPYIECWRLVDRHEFSKLPAEYRRHFRPAAEPGMFALHKTTKVLKIALVKKYSARQKLKFPELDNRYVCFRLCRDLMLAPQIYVGALRLLKLVEKQRRDNDPPLSWGEEVPAACATIVAAKLYYGLDGVPRRLPASREGDEFDWQVWRDLMRKTWLMMPDFGRADERLVQYWTGDEIDSYLDWFQFRLGAENELDKRLENIFPQSKKTETVDYSTASADATVINELCAMLHGTRGSAHYDNLHDPHDDPHSDPNSDPHSDPHDDEPSLPAAGSYYQVYSVRSDAAEELPEMVGLLYNIVSLFLGADEHRIRRVVRLFEKWIKNQHAKLVTA